MRPDNGQILTKIPSFILISCFPFARHRTVILSIQVQADDSPAASPAGYSQPWHCRSSISATPRGPSSPSTTLRCSIYKRSFPKRARFFQPAGDKFLDLAFSLLDETTFTIALWYCSRVSDRAIMRSVRNEKCVFLYSTTLGRRRMIVGFEICKRNFI